MKSFKIFFAALTALMFAVCARAENISGGEKLARECAAYMDWDFDGKPVSTKRYAEIKALADSGDPYAKFAQGVCL